MNGMNYRRKGPLQIVLLDSAVSHKTVKLYLQVDNNKENCFFVIGQLGHHSLLLNTLRVLNRQTDKKNAQSFIHQNVSEVENMSDLNKSYTRGLWFTLYSPCNKLKIAKEMLNLGYQIKLLLRGCNLRPNLYPCGEKSMKDMKKN